MMRAQLAIIAPLHHVDNIHLGLRQLPTAFLPQQSDDCIMCVLADAHVLQQQGLPVVNPSIAVPLEAKLMLASPETAC